MNNRGVTIIELLIYIILFVMISLLIGRQFKMLTNNYSSGKRIAREQTDTRDVLGLMVREIRNTGLKVYFTGNDTTRSKNISKVGSVIITAGTDSSSFIHTDGTPNDKLTIKKLRLTRSGDYEFTDKVDYYVDGTTLRRALKTTDVPDSTNSVVAENVYGLQFLYGVAKKDSVIWDDDPIVPGNWSVSSGTGSISTGAANQLVLTLTGATNGAIKCSYKRSVVKNNEYGVHLKITPSFTNNSTDIDSMRFAFKSGYSYYGAESFKPYSSDMTIPVKTTGGGSADMLLEYSVKSAGKFTIAAVEVSRTEDSVYTWVSNPVTASVKMNVRAIKVFVLMRSAGTTGAKAPSSMKVGPVTVNPPAGSYSWRVFEQTIEVPNNGIF